MERAYLVAPKGAARTDTPGGPEGREGVREEGAEAEAAAAADVAGVVGAVEVKTAGRHAAVSSNL